MADQVSAVISIGADTTPLESQLQAALNRIEKGFKFNSPFGGANSEVSAFDKSLASANQRVITFGASLAILGAGIKIFKDIVSSVTEVESAFIEINSIFNLSRESLDKFSKQLFDVARNTSQSFESAADAAKEFSRQGLSAEETIKRTNDALVLTRLTNLDVADSVNVLTAAVNGFQKSGLSTTDLLNKFVAVDQNFAVSASDLAQGFARAGASASDAGVSVNELIGLITAAQQTTARGGAVIGNALKTIFTRAQRPEVINDFEALGVKIKDAQGYLLPTIDILKNFAATYDTLSGAIKNQAAELVGGVYQINIFKAAINDLSKANGIFAQSSLISANAQDEALKRNELLNQSYQALGEQIATTNKQILSNVGNQAFGSIVKPVLKGALNNPIVDALKDASGEATTYGGVLAQGILKGIGNALLIGIGPILFAAAANIVKKTATSTFNSVLSETGLLRAQKQTSETEKTVQLYIQGDAALKAQLATFTDLNAAANNLNTTLSKGIATERGVGNAGRVSAASFGGAAVIAPEINPTLGTLLAGGTVSAKKLRDYGKAVRTDVISENYPGVNPGEFEATVRDKAVQKELASFRATNPNATNILNTSVGPNYASQVLGNYPLHAQNVESAVAKELAAVDAAVAARVGAATSLNSENKIREKLGIATNNVEYVLQERNKGLSSVFGTSRGDAKYLTSQLGINGKLSPEQDFVSGLPLQALASQRLNNRRNFGFGASLVAPLLAGAVPNGEAGTNGGIASGATSGALNGAGIGASIGTFFPEILPFTIAAGAFIGGMTGALNKLHKSFEELVQEHVNDNQKNEEELNAAQSIFKLVDDLKSAAHIQDPNERNSANDRITENINDTFNNHIFDKKIRAIITNLLNNPSDSNEETQQKALGNIASQKARTGNNSLTAFQSIRDFVTNLQREEGHFETTVVPGADGAATEFIPGKAKGPSDALASSLLPLLPSGKEIAPQVENTLRGVINGGSPKDALQNILKSGGSTDAEISNLKLTDELAKVFLEKVLELFQRQGGGGVAGNTAGKIGVIETEKTKRLPDLSQSIVAQEQIAAEIKASAESNLKINQNFQRILQARPNTNLGKIQQQGDFDITNLTTDYQAKLQETIATGKGKLFAATKGHENTFVNDEIDKVDINNPSTIDNLLKLATGTPAEKGKLGGAGTDEFIKALRELKKSTDDLNSSYNKSKKTAEIVNQQNQDEENSKGSPVLALKADRDYAGQAQTDFDNAKTRGDSEDVIRNLQTNLDLLNIETKRRLGALGQPGGITQAESDTDKEIKRNVNEIGAINQYGKSALDIARDRAAKFNQSPFTSGSQVQQTQFEVAQLQGIRGDAVGSFKTGFSSVVDGFKKDADQLADIGKQLADSLSSNLGNAFGDFVTGAKSGSAAFKSFVTSILNDASRAFANKAIQTLIGAFLGAAGGGDAGGGIESNLTLGSTGGQIGYAKGGTVSDDESSRLKFAVGGMVPSLLMGGEYVVSPNAAKKIGYSTLQRLNRFADGGMVSGGSGTQDDVPANLPSGSFVIRKSSVQKLGPKYLNALVGGQVQHRDLGGALIGAFLGAAVGGGAGYLIGGKKGAVIGAGIGAIGGGLYGGGAFSNASVTSGANASAGASAPAGLAEGQVVNGITAGGGGLNSLSATQKALLGLGVAGVLGVAASALGNKKEAGPISNDQVPAYASNIENTQLAYLASNAGKYPYLQPNPQGGYSLAGFGDAPATRRFADGGGVNTPIIAGGDGGGAKVDIKIEINNNGATSSSGTSNGKNSAFGENFAGKLQKQVQAMVKEELVNQSRSDGILAKGNPLGVGRA